MAKLTRQQKNTIRFTLDHLERARKYLMNPDLYIIHESQITMFPKDTWTNGEGTRAVSVNKEIGSDLAGLSHAIYLLNGLLELDGKREGSAA